MAGSEKFHLTQSLLSSWQYSFITEDGYEKFLKDLKRIREPPTEAMLEGVRFENCVNAALDGSPVPTGEKYSEQMYYKCVRQLAKYLKGSQKQVNLRKDIIVDGVCFELNGVLDFLKKGIIYDTKFSKTYDVGKYFKSPQHPMYFYLVPEAYEFQYLVCDGKFVCREFYHPEDVTPIEVTVRQFMQYLDRAKLIDLYARNFELKNYYSSKEKEK